MAVDIFLTLEDVKGETKDAKYKDKNGIDVLSWSWGMSQSGTTHSGTGGGSGKANVQDLSITKYVDKASCDLMKGCCKGTHFKKGSLIVRKAGDKPYEFWQIDLEEIIVAACTTGGIGSDDRMTENITLNFAKFDCKYSQQADDGSVSEAGECKWDIPANAEY
jgi:type VI secretion system secreted protein Hcp